MSSNSLAEQTLLYLYEGIGDPCAGHVRAMPELRVLLKADKSTADENLGFADPIGSKVGKN